MFGLMEFFVRKNQESEGPSLRIKIESCVNFIVAGISIAFTALRDSFVSSQEEGFQLDTRSKERSRLIAQNAQALANLAQYFKKSLGFSQNIQAVENSLIKFKRDCDLGEKYDLFIYEFDLAEMIDFLASSSNIFSEEHSAYRHDIYSLPKINLVLMNYFIQLFIQIDIMWKIPAEKIKEVARVQITHYQEKSASKLISKSCLFLFVGLTFKQKSSSL